MFAGDTQQRSQNIVQSERQPMMLVLAGLVVIACRCLSLLVIAAACR
jgi:hypothetical protein